MKLIVFKFLALFSIFCSVHFFSQISDAEATSVLKNAQATQTTNPEKTIQNVRSIVRGSSSPSMKSQALITISLCKGILGERDSAIIYAHQGKDFALKTSDPNQIVRSYGNLSTQYRNVKLYNSAKKQVEEGLDYLQKVESTGKTAYLRAGFYRENARINMLENKVDSAIIYTNKGIAFIEKSQDKDYPLNKVTLAILHGDLAQYYVKKNKTQLSEEHAAKALEIAKGSPFEEKIKADVYTYLASSYLQKNETNRALDTLKVVDQGVSNKELPQKATIANQMAAAYKQLGDSINSNKFDHNASALEKKLFKEDDAAHNSAISILNQENSIAKEETKTNRTIIYMLIVVSSLTIAITSYLFYKKRKKERNAFLSYIEILKSKHAELESKFSTNNKTENPVSVCDNDAKTKISNGVEQVILEKLAKFEEQKKYLEVDTTLYKMSNEIKTNPKYLSEIISKYKSQNFNSYINELRINNICSLILTNPKYRTYKVSYLAEVSGFSSAENFSRIFKKVTGISPSIFITNSEYNS